MSHPLREAFLATRYRICLDPVWIETRIGTPSVGLAEWLRRQHCAQASLISACNPRGDAVPAELNAALAQRLRQRLEQEGWRFWPAEGLAEDGAWREPSLFVPGLHGAECRVVMRDFDQLAWVEYDASGLARLRWTDESEFPA